MTTYTIRTRRNQTISINSNSSLSSYAFTKQVRRAVTAELGTDRWVDVSVNGCLTVVSDWYIGVAKRQAAILAQAGHARLLPRRA